MSQKSSEAQDGVQSAAPTLSSPSHSAQTQSHTNDSRVCKSNQSGSRKRWKSNEVHMLLLACVHFRRLYHSNPSQGLERLESALCSTINAPASKLRVKIKNIRSAHGRSSLPNGDIALLNAFLGNVDDSDLPASFSKELRDSLPNLASTDKQCAPSSDCDATASEDDRHHKKHAPGTAMPGIGLHLCSQFVPQGVNGMYGNHVPYNFNSPTTVQSQPVSQPARVAHHAYTTDQLPFNSETAFSIISRLDHHAYLLNRISSTLDTFVILLEKKK